MAHESVRDYKRLRIAADELNSGLDWSSSVEGGEYWREVYYRLETYAACQTPPPLKGIAPTQTGQVKASKPAEAAGAEKAILARLDGLAENKAESEELFGHLNKE